MLINRSHITIMVADINKAISFYESISLTLKNKRDDLYASLEAPGVTLALYRSEAEVRHEGSASFGFVVDDIAEAGKLLNEHNIASIRDDWSSGSYLHFTDHDGTKLYFVQPK